MSKVELVKNAIETMSANTLYLDGAMQGTVIDLALDSYSFDHHGGQRFDKSAASLQVALAVLQGLDLSDIKNIKVSSVDADSVLSLMVAQHPETAKDLEFIRFLQDVSRIDNHGPSAVVPGEAQYKCFFDFRASRGEEETTEMLVGFAEEAFSRYEAGTLYETSAPFNQEGEAIVLDTKGTILFRVAGEVGFADIYKEGSFGLLVQENKGQFKFTIGKLPFANVPSFKSLFPLLSEKEDEGTWGGADSIGGSPFTGSSLVLTDVIGVIKGWLK